MIGGDDAKGPRSVRFRIVALFKQAFRQPAGSPSLPITMDKVMTVLLRPAAIALVVDLLKTPPRFR